MDIIKDYRKEFIKNCENSSSKEKPTIEYIAIKKLINKYKNISILDIDYLINNCDLIAKKIGWAYLIESENIQLEDKINNIQNKIAEINDIEVITFICENLNKQLEEEIFKNNFTNFLIKITQSDNINTQILGLKLALNSLNTIGLTSAVKILQMVEVNDKTETEIGTYLLEIYKKSNNLAVRYIVNNTEKITTKILQSTEKKAD